MADLKVVLIWWQIIQSVAILIATADQYFSDLYIKVHLVDDVFILRSTACVYVCLNVDEPLWLMSPRCLYT